MSDETFEMAIKSSLRQKNSPILPSDLIDDFELGAADVKHPRLRKAIWQVLGSDIRAGLVRLIQRKEIILQDDGRIVLTEVYEQIKRGTILKPVKNN